MKKVFSIILTFFLVLGLIFMLFNTNIVSEGVHAGLSLWYESVMPTILPFMLITSYLLRFCKGKYFCLFGMFCGIPVGATLVTQEFKQGRITRHEANHFLCVCNSVSPMFILGYVLNQALQNQANSLIFVTSVYLPPLLYFICTILLPSLLKDHSRTNRNAKTTSISSAMDNVNFQTLIQEILIINFTIALYIMIFCVIIHLLQALIPPTHILNNILLGTLELTNGIHIYSLLPLCTKQKTAFISALTSTGGICSILQTMSVLPKHKLSLFHYITMKIVFAILSYTIIMVLL